MLPKDGFPVKVSYRILKVFDSIVYDLLLVKLNGYGFDYNSLELINSFLSGTKFRTKISSSCSPNDDLSMSILQGSTYGHFSFIYIEICDLFLCDC